MKAESSGWAPAQPEPPREAIDWDLYLGPAAWRPFNAQHLDGFNFEKGGGLVGGGILEWGSHCVDLCQLANDADETAAVEYQPPKDGKLVAKYANGVKLVIREDDWLPLGSCPVRFEGDAGWVETADSGKMVFSSPELRPIDEVPEIGGYPITFHVRNFLECIKSRAATRCNADIACNSHLTCHAANIAIYLDRPLLFDPERCVFTGDDQANRLLSEAQREPWAM
jgi:hypothetical protein